MYVAMPFTAHGSWCREFARLVGNHLPWVWIFFVVNMWDSPRQKSEIPSCFSLVSHGRHNAVADAKDKV